jgi:hypothetical protein
MTSVTSYGSSTTTLLTAPTSGPHVGQTLDGSSARSRFTATAVASSGVPSENRTPRRRENVQLRPSGASRQPVARLGWICPSWSILVSDSTTIWTTFITVVVVWRIGSSVSGSTPIAIRSSEPAPDDTASAAPTPPQPVAAARIVSSSARHLTS